MSSHTAEILYADDHDLVRETVAELLARHFDGATIQTVEDAVTALDQVKGVDLLILDWNMPGMEDGLIIPDFQTSNPEARIVVLSGVADPDIVREAIRLGIHGYIPKSYAPKQMLAALDLIMSGQRFIPDLAFEQSPGEHSSGDHSGGEQAVDMSDTESAILPVRDRDACLTPKEREILCSLAGGQSNKHIAREHNISETTVKSHLKNIYAKMGFQSRGEAMSYVLSQRR